METIIRDSELNEAMAQLRAGRLLRKGPGRPMLTVKGEKQAIAMLRSRPPSERLMFLLVICRQAAQARAMAEFEHGTRKSRKE